MQIENPIKSLLIELEKVIPSSLGDIIDVINKNENINKIIMFINNHKNSKKYFDNVFEQLLLDDPDDVSDIQLAGLLVIMSRINENNYVELVSAISCNENLKWARTMANSFLLKELCQRLED